MEKEMTRRNVLKAGIAAAAVGAIPLMAKPASAQTKKIKWRMQTHWPAGVGYYKPHYLGFAERVKEASNGEIDINPLPAGSMSPTKDMLEAVGRGVFEIAHSWPAYWIGQIPVAGHLNGQLFSWANFEELYVFMYEMGALDIIRKAYEERGVHLLGIYSVGGITLFSKRPLVKPSDFKGFKVRATGIPAKVFTKIGATPVFFSGEEVYQALQTGVCDGAYWGSVAGGWEMKFQEVSKYIIMPFLSHQNIGEIIVNKKVWDALPNDKKRLLTDCCHAMNANSNPWYVYRDYIHMQEFKDKFKGEIVTMSPDTVALLRKYAMEVVDEYSKLDPKYCGKVGELLHKFMKMTGKM